MAPATRNKSLKPAKLQKAPKKVQIVPLKADSSSKSKEEAPPQHLELDDGGNNSGSDSVLSSDGDDLLADDFLQESNDEGDDNEDKASDSEYDSKLDSDSDFRIDNGASCLPIPPEEEKRIVYVLINLKEGNLYSLVTKRIKNCLNFLFLNPESEVSPEALLEVLCSLSTLSTLSNMMSGDGITFNARLLDAGIKKVFSPNRQMCVIKLPNVFNDLKDILASEHEEAIFAAADALKSIINYCIDETLIKQGVDQITLDESRWSGPTIIERICAIVESLLDYHYSGAWDKVFEVVSAMFHKLGSNSPYFMRGILKNLEDMQKLPDEDFPFRKQLHACLGSTLVVMGPETLLSLIPLNVEAENLFVSNIWLFPILKQYIVGGVFLFIVWDTGKSNAATTI